MAKKSDILLSEALIARGLLSKEEAEQLTRDAVNSGTGLLQLLSSRRRIPEVDILHALGEQLHISMVNLKETNPDKAAIIKVPLKIAAYYKFVPLSLKDRVLTIALSYPLDIKIQDEIRTQLGCDIAFAFAPEAEVAEAFKKYYGLGAETLEGISAQTTGIEKIATLADLQENIEDIEKLATDASVIKLVNQIILEAYRRRATDIHLEPYRGTVALRYRVDGILYDAVVPPEIKNFVNAIISRVKIMSNLNIVERRLPQDGRAVVRVQEQVLDLRISTIPTPFGESVVIRILPTQMLFSLEKLGLAKIDVALFEKFIQKPHGIIFVTGPTGSGKTTTLYTCLSRINTKDRKIITIEDPIEYEMAGITQIQVMPEIGLTFAAGLRSILRHDPDVIMVGEVRDLETAEIAIRVALTGHLVFSTVHTNDAASGITRLLDIGLEPYLVASSVEAFIAQRLIRVICPDCKYEDVAAPIELRELIGHDINISPDKVKVFRGKGCAPCNFTGYFSRTAIYEILAVDEVIKDLIVKKAIATNIKRVAISKGMRTLRQDGWQKVIAGITTPEEVMKVTSAEEGLVTREYLRSDQRISAQAGESSPESRRIYERLDSKVNVRYNIVTGEGKTLEQGIRLDRYSATTNVSAGGVVFVSDEQLSVGSMIELHLELPDGGQKPIECLARVVRIDEVEPGRTYNVAVCFLDMTGTERGRLNKFVGKSPK